MTATELLKKHGIKPTKTKKANAAIQKVLKDKAQADVPDQVVKAAEDFRQKIVKEKPGSRADLMAQARVKGIKYFRILTKKELEVALYTNSQADIDKIIAQAKNRWKSGWGSQKAVTE